MKTWYIAGLVIVGLIVVAIAYGMYARDSAWGKKLRGWWSGFAVLDNRQVPKNQSSAIPGGVQANVERPAAPGLSIKDL